MRKWLLALIAIIVAAIFASYMVTYTVSYTDEAVVTTFGRAGDGSVITEPGLKWKLPAPIQSTTVYDTRVRFLEARLEQQQTADDRQIVVRTFLTWRVDDPLTFYQRFSGAAGADIREHYRKAEDTITSLLRGAVSEVSRYELGELFSPEPGASKLSELEQAIYQRIQGGADGGITDYGVSVEMVGINGVELTENTTKEVFERMKARREKLAAKAESEGSAAATAITSESQSDARRIRAFAELRASELANEGGVEAAAFLAQLQEEPELAVFTQFLDLMTGGFGDQATLVLPTNMFGLGIFSPEAFGDALQGRIPDVNLDTARLDEGEGEGDQIRETSP
jgi:membrane protease subunit HflC